MLAIIMPILAKNLREWYNVYGDVMKRDKKYYLFHCYMGVLRIDNILIL